MKDIVKEVLAHPIATVLVLGAIGTFVVNIVGAAKGISMQPLVDVSLSK